MFSQIIQRSWYRPFGIVTILLLPFSALFCALSTFRQWMYGAGVVRQNKLSVPVIIVGNISVGGTGKTPLVVAITEYLKSSGYKPGIVSRGYGGSAQNWPIKVTAESDPAEVGDEAVLLANRCACPMSVGPNRVSAAEKLLQDSQCNIIVSDDGLQHLALGRDIEIIVIDGERRFGNGLCLPAGPLRELSSRTNRADIVVSNGNAHADEYEMQLIPEQMQKVSNSDEKLSLKEFSQKQVHAVAGIGNNERFFKTLENLGISIKRHAFEDHHEFKREDLNFDDDLPVLMTEKDAVKCRKFESEDYWFLKISAQLPDAFFHKLDHLLTNKTGRE